jgi:hypothetical protein
VHWLKVAGTPGGDAGGARVAVEERPDRVVAVEVDADEVARQRVLERVGQAAVDQVSALG